MPHFVLDARTATPHFPGIGRYVSNLARAMAPLIAADERLTLLCDPAYPIVLPPSDAVQTIPLVVSPFSLRQQWLIPRLLRHLRQNGPWTMDHGPSSIVHRPSLREAARSSIVYHSPYIAMPYWPGVPTVLTVYDLIPLRYPAHSTARARLLIRGMTRLALHAARCIVAISEFTRNDFVAEFGLPPERITAIPLAADPAFKRQTAEKIAEIRARYNLPERFILYLGSNKPHKNLVRLVEAWDTANSRWQIANSSLVVAGAWDPSYPEARKAAESAAHETSATDGHLRPSTFNLRPVFWLGPVPEADLPALYSAATAFVFPSLYEGFGLPVLEAMACGTPVICSDASSLPEVTGQTQRRKDAKTPTETRSSGQSGSSVSSAFHSSEQAAALLIDPLDANTLAASIGRVMSDEALRRELAQRGLAQAARFSWERTAQATLDVYRRLAAG